VLVGFHWQRYLCIFNRCRRASAACRSAGTGSLKLLQEALHVTFRQPLCFTELAVSSRYVNECRRQVVTMTVSGSTFHAGQLCPFKIVFFNRLHRKFWTQNTAPKFSQVLFPALHMIVTVALHKVRRCISARHSTCARSHRRCLANPPVQVLTPEHERMNMDKSLKGIEEEREC